MAPARREVAQALGALTQPEFRRLLVPLMYDQNRDVALEAIRSAGRLPGEDYLFVPQLVSLLRNRLLKAAARNVLVGYGTGVVPTLAYFLRDQDEDVWVRRHIPSTLARIPGQQTMDVLVDALNEKDGFLRYKVISAIGRMRLDDPSLKVPAEKVHELLGQESKRYFTYLSFRYNLVRADKAAENTLLARALHEKVERTVDRIYRLLGPDLSVEGHPRGALVARERRPAHQGERGRVPRQHAGLEPAQAHHAGARGVADRGEGQAREHDPQDAHP